MSDLELAIGAYRYEHTEALFDGSVTIEGVDAKFDTSPLISDVFYRMVQGDYDVAEFGLSYFLRMWDTKERPFLALPIFPNRNFRHSAIFINTSSGIGRPEDLAGKTVGEFAMYGHDAGVWPKGILSDDFGVKPDSCRWVIGGTDYPIPAFDWIPQPVPAGIDVRHTGEGETLGAMLESGEIDALISVDVPKAILNGSPRVARLFPDYESVERDYYRRTGIFPPMHVVAIRKELTDNTGLVEAVYTAFLEAKNLVEQKYIANASKQHMSVITPWFSSLFSENRRLLGEDWWPYGLEKNRTAIDTFLRYHYEQGLSKSQLTSEDIFVPQLLGS